MCGDHEKSLNSWLNLSRLWVYIGASGFAGLFCCWLRSLDRDWELIPLNLMEKSDKKPSSPQTALVLPSRRGRIHLLNPFMAPAGKRFQPSWNILWSHPSVFCIPLLSFLHYRCFPSRQRSSFWVWIILLLVPIPSSHLHFPGLFPVSPGGFCSFSPQKFP